MVKPSKVITQQPKTKENSNIIDIKSITVEHPKTSCKLSKITRQTKNVSTICPWYKEKAKKWWNKKQKKAKITKRFHAYKGYASTDNNKFFFLNSELQLKVLKRYILEFLKQNIAAFTGPQRLKELLMRLILMMSFNQSILRLYQTYKNYQEN